MPKFVTWTNIEERKREFLAAKLYFRLHPDECKLKRSQNGQPTLMLTNPHTGGSQCPLTHSFMRFHNGKNTTIVAMKEKPAESDSTKPQGAFGTIIFCEDEDGNTSLIKVIHEAIQGDTLDIENRTFRPFALSSTETLKKRVDSEKKTMNALGLLKGYNERKTTCHLKLWVKNIGACSTENQYTVTKHYLLMAYLGIPLEEYEVPDQLAYNEISLQLLNYLARIHNAGFIHGDISLSNATLLQEKDGKIICSLIDYGLSTEISKTPQTAKQKQLEDTKELITEVLISLKMRKGTAAEQQTDDNQRDIAEDNDQSRLFLILQCMQKVRWYAIPSIRLLQVIFLVEQYQTDHLLTQKLTEYEHTIKTAQTAKHLHAAFTASIASAVLISLLEKCGVVTEVSVTLNGPFHGLKPIRENINALMNLVLNGHSCPEMVQTLQDSYNTATLPEEQDSSHGSSSSCRIEHS